MGTLPKTPARARNTVVMMMTAMTILRMMTPRVKAPGRNPNWILLLQEGVLVRSLENLALSH